MLRVRPCKCQSDMSRGVEDRRTSLVERLKDVVTFLGLLVSQTARVPAAIRKTLAGTIVRMVSSKSKVKSNSRLEAGPN